MVSSECDPELEKRWGLLRNAIRACLRPGADVTQTDCLGLYSVVYNVVNEHSETRAAGLYLRLRAHLHAHARACAAIVSGGSIDEASEERTELDLWTEDTCQLTQYAALWSAYKKGVSRISVVFCNLDSCYTKENANTFLSIDNAEVPVLSVADTALVAWRSEVILKVGSTLLTRARQNVAALRMKLDDAETSSCASETQRLIRVLLQSIVAVGDTVLVTSNDSDSDSIESEPTESYPRKESTETLSANPMQIVYEMVVRVRGCSNTEPAPINKVQTTVEAKEKRVLALYRNLWEGGFLEDAGRFYAERAQSLLQEPDANIRRYVAMLASEALERELQFAANFVHESTIGPLRRVLQVELVANHRTRLCAAADGLLQDAAKARSFEELVASGLLDDLRLLYSVLEWMGDAKVAVATSLRRHATSAGANALRSISSHNGALDELLLEGCSATKEKPSPASQFVSEAWGMYTRLQRVVVEALGGDISCQRALNQACEQFVNGVDASPVLLAQFMHELLELGSASRATIDGCTDDGCDGYDDYDGNDSREKAEWARRAARMFRFLSDKQAFQQVYAKRLARRLMFGTSRATLAEMEVLELLGDLCGPDYISRLKRMFADVEASEVMTKEFESVHAMQTVNDECKCESFELNVLVLSSAAWPVGESDDSACNTNKSNNKNALTVRSTTGNTDTAVASAQAAEERAERMRLDAAPLHALPSLAAASALFVQHYTDCAAHARRRLSWAHSHCRVWLSGRVTPNSDTVVDIEATLTQTAILMYFSRAGNGSGSASTSELSGQLGIRLEEVLEGVRALVRGGVLEYQGDGDDSEHKSRLKVVHQLPHQSTLRVGLIPRATSGRDVDGERARGASQGDRRTQISATMVRLMKTNRTMEESILFTQVIDELTSWFTPQLPDLMHVADYLVENEYMDRVDSVFHYVP